MFHDHRADLRFECPVPIARLGEVGGARGSRLADDRASCYVQQRRPDLAEPILLGLLNQHQSGRRRGIALVDLATVSAQRPDVLRLVTYGAAAVDHTRHTNSGVVLRKLQNLRPTLADLRSDPHVRNLDDEIAQLTITHR